MSGGGEVIRSKAMDYHWCGGGNENATSARLCAYDAYPTMIQLHDKEIIASAKNSERK